MPLIMILVNGVYASYMLMLIVTLQCVGVGAEHLQSAVCTADASIPFFVP